jgi:hypothetical protein
VPSSEPKSHHFVQRAYLDAFCDPQPGNKKPFLWVYSPKREVRFQNTKECATENYFYCFEKDGARSFEVEHAIADLENHSLPLLVRPQQGLLPATPQDRLTLAGYVALAVMRTPAARSIFNQAVIDVQVKRLRELANVPGELETVLREHEIKSGEKLDPDEQRRKLKAGKMRAVIPDPDWSLRCMLEQTLQLQSHFVKMDWTLVRAERAFFLTSDFPLLLSDPSLAHIPDGANSPDFLFPLSRDTCLAGGGFGREEFVFSDAAEVRKINLALIERAQRFVFSPFRAPYVQQKLDQSFEARETSKVSDVIQL